MVLCEAEIDRNRFAVADVEETVGLWWNCEEELYVSAGLVGLYGQIRT